MECGRCLCTTVRVWKMSVEGTMAKTGSRRPPEYSRKHDRILHRAATAKEIECDLILAPLQKELERLDGKYGYDRLPKLISVETAARWGKACAGLHDAVGAQDADKVKAWVIVCLRGLAAMDAEAAVDPTNIMPPDIWDCHDDEGSFCIIRDGSRHQQASKLRPGRRIYTTREVAVALRQMQTAVVDSVKDLWAGAEIVGVRKIEGEHVDDDLDAVFGSQTR